MHFIHPSVTLKASTVFCFYKGHLSLLSESNPALASCGEYKRNDTKHYSLTKGERLSLRHGCFLGTAQKLSVGKTCLFLMPIVPCLRRHCSEKKKLSKPINVISSHLSLGKSEQKGWWGSRCTQDPSAQASFPSVPKTDPEKGTAFTGKWCGVQPQLWVMEQFPRGMGIYSG